MFFRTNKNVVAVIFFFLQIVKDKGEAFETTANIFAYIYIQICISSNPAITQQPMAHTVFGTSW